MAKISDIVSLSIQTAGKSITPDNMNNVMLITSDTSFLSTAKRFASYKDASSVANNFGSGNVVTQFAKTFFSQRVTPIDAGGILYIGYHRADTEAVAATAASLEGAEITDSALIDELNQVDDGAFDIDIDGVTVNVTGVDMQADEDLDDVASTLDTAVSGASVSFANNKFTITSDSTGASSELTYATSPSSGTDVSVLLGWTESQGGTLTQGAASDSLSSETKEEAVTELLSQAKFRAFQFIDNTTDDEVPDLASFAQANDVMSYDVFEDTSAHLTVGSSNPAWNVRTSGQENYRMLLSKSGNRQLATAYMARMHTVQFSGDNTAITMHLKDLVNVTPESYTAQQEADAKRIGLEIYTSFKDVGKVVSSGKNNFTDNVYNKMALRNEVETAVFNLLGTTPTKIAQTEEGVATLVDTIEQVLIRFEAANYLNPGKWTLSTTFGNPDQLKSQVASKGYYIFANPLSEQSQTSRTNRESPLIQIAVKLAGAIHSVSMIMNINK